MIATVLIPLLMMQTAPDSAVMLDHARIGAVYERLDGAAAESARACDAACGLDQSCQAWTWRPRYGGDRPARCELLSAAPTARAYPGAVTGLSVHLAERIESAGERAPSPEERAVLTATNQTPG